MMIDPTRVDSSVEYAEMPDLLLPVIPCRLCYSAQTHLYLLGLDTAAPRSPGPEIGTVMPDSR